MKRLLIAAALTLLAALPAEAFETHTTVACGTGTTTVLAAQNNRTYAIFVNDSDTVIYLRVGGTATTGDIRLNANGGSWEIANAFGNLTGSGIECIHGGSGNKNLNVYEKGL